MMHRIILIILPVLEPFVFGEECQSFYNTQALCDTIYGSTLSTYSHIRSLTECVVQCSIDELCLSAIYVNGSGDCRTNTGILVTPDTGCLETVWYASVLQVSMSCLSLDWLQSLKHFFINASYHILVASLTLMALF